MRYAVCDMQCLSVDNISELGAVIHVCYSYTRYFLHVLCSFTFYLAVLLHSTLFVYVLTCCSASLLPGILDVLPTVLSF